MTPQRTVAILIFDDAEVLDFCGPFEVFSVTGRNADPKPFHVVTVAEKPGPISARNGLSVNPAHTIDTCPPPDILLIPGGRGTRREMHNPILTQWIREQAGRVELVLSVCTGALMLATAGLLDGLRATTHRDGMQLLAETSPSTTLCPDERFVDNGRIVTSAGISAGIDMSLYVVARLLGRDIAEQTAYYMEYDWRPEAAA